MFTLLLATGIKGEEIADSGPGPKYLVSGNRDLGYFGAFPINQFGLLDSLLELPVDRASFKSYSELQDNEWIKLIIDGKIVYTTRRPIGTGLSYNELDRSGMVLGDDGFNTSLQTKQDAKISIVDSDDGVEWVVAPRLSETWKGFKIKSSVTSFPSVSDQSYLDSEHNLVINALARAPSSGSGVDPIPAIGLGMLIAPADQTSDPNDSKRALSQEKIVAGGSVSNTAPNVSGGGSSSVVYSGDDLVNYRPWLELMPAGTNPVSVLRELSFGTSYPVAAVINSSDDPNSTPMYPALLTSINQNYIGPTTDYESIHAAVLMETNQEYFGPYIEN